MCICTSLFRVNYRSISLSSEQNCHHFHETSCACLGINQARAWGLLTPLRDGGVERTTELSSEAALGVPHAPVSISLPLEGSPISSLVLRGKLW